MACAAAPLETLDVFASSVKRRCLFLSVSLSPVINRVAVLRPDSQSSASPRSDANITKPNFRSLQIKTLALSVSNTTRKQDINRPRNAGFKLIGELAWQEA